MGEPRRGKEGMKEMGAILHMIPGRTGVAAKLAWEPQPSKETNIKGLKNGH